MSRHRYHRIIRYYVRWSILSSLIGVLCGTASAVFLFVLERTTLLREHHPTLLYLLPVGGLIVGGLYHFFGRSVEGGNNLIIDEFHNSKSVIPIRMAPLVLLGTVFTHLFGGSAGREGTAVQMGGSIADQFTHFIKANVEQRRTLLMAGMSGGFGSVFGVPFAGMIFGMEVLNVGNLHIWSFVECGISAFVAHYVTLAWGIHHTQYFSPTVPVMTYMGTLVAIVVGIVCGGAARLFAFLTEGVAKVTKSIVKLLPIRAFIGGVVISLLFFLFPMLTRYTGLGVPIIEESIKGQVPIYDWFGKIAFTALTLGSGFKGGEVTPLLFIGSTLGNALGQFLPLNVPLLGAMGFVAVFSGAANTPFACTVMAMEIFGSGVWSYAALACFASYLVSGHHGIYHAQKVSVPKDYYISRTKEFGEFVLNRIITHTHHEQEREKENDQEK